MKSNNWYNVLEKLPEYDKKVLIWTPDGSLMASLWQSCKCGDVDHFSDGNWCADLYEITHWMYLPVAPVKTQPKTGKNKIPNHKSKFNTSLKRSNFNFWG